MHSKPYTKTCTAYFIGDKFILKTEVYNEVICFDK